MIKVLLGQLSLCMLFLVLSNERVAALGPAWLHMIFLNFLGGFSLNLGGNHISEGFSNKSYESSARFGVLMVDFCELIILERIRRTFCQNLLTTRHRRGPRRAGTLLAELHGLVLDFNLLVQLVRALAKEFIEHVWEFNPHLFYVVY